MIRVAAYSSVEPAAARVRRHREGGWPAQSRGGTGADGHRLVEGYLSGEHPVFVRITAPAGTKAFPIFQTNDDNESPANSSRRQPPRGSAIRLASRRDREG